MSGIPVIRWATTSEVQWGGSIAQSRIAVIQFSPVMTRMRSITPWGDGGVVRQLLGCSASVITPLLLAYMYILKTLSLYIYILSLSLYIYIYTERERESENYIHVKKSTQACGTK